MRDIDSNSPFTGYENKKKRLFYYKTRQPGININLAAKKINLQFQQLLQAVEFDVALKEKLKAKLKVKLSNYFDVSQDDMTANKKRMSELQKNLDLLEERYVLNEIKKEQFDKFSKKFASEMDKLQQETMNLAEMSSNLEFTIEKGLKIAEKASQLWISANYYDKQRIQYLLFPEGILYDNKTKRVLTKRVNFLFREIAEIARDLGENQNDNPLLDCHFGSHVGMTRFELATPRPPDVCATGLRYIPKTP